MKLAAGYAAFANGGYKVTPYFIDRVDDGRRRGAVREQAADLPRVQHAARDRRALEPETPELVADITELYPKQRAAPRVISPQNSYLISDMLQRRRDRAAPATARAPQLDRDDLAGKTGTTNDGRDTWFVGFNANIVGAAWVGFDQNRPLGGYEQGGRTAHADVDRLHARSARGYARAVPKRPPGIVEYPDQSRDRA